MKQEELNSILELHRKWLYSEPDGKRANLRYADLRSADLCGANLRSADLCGADLCGANLRDADLCGANLRYADLCGADLCGADLRSADLCGANLRSADLRSANLRSAKNAELAAARTEIVPREGSFVGWKKCTTDKVYVIVKLRIPEDAKRSNATGRKCRASKAEVLQVETVEGKIEDWTAYSLYFKKLKYKAGETLEVDDFCEDRFEECAPGIHFYLTREEAVSHQ